MEQESAAAGRPAARIQTLRRCPLSGSNTTADHITVLDDALAQIPDTHRHGTPILIRSDSAGCAHGLLAHIRSLRDRGLDTRFSVGVAITEPIRQAIAKQ